MLLFVVVPPALRVESFPVVPSTSSDSLPPLAPFLKRTRSTDPERLFTMNRNWAYMSVVLDTDLYAYVAPPPVANSRATYVPPLGAVYPCATVSPLTVPQAPNEPLSKSSVNSTPA